MDVLGDRCTGKAGGREPSDCPFFRNIEKYKIKTRDLVGSIQSSSSLDQENG